MEVWEYNHWLAYFMLQEQDEHKQSTEQKINKNGSKSKDKYSCTR